jgi:hypothetical protein
MNLLLCDDRNLVEDSTSSRPNNSVRNKNVCEIKSSNYHHHQSPEQLLPKRFVQRRHSRTTFMVYSVRSSTGTPVIVTEIFRSVPQSLHSNSGIVSRLGQDLFLPNPFHFIIIHVSPIIRRYTVSILKASVNNLRKRYWVI